METGKYTLNKIDNNGSIPFSLLLMADETKAAIDKYIHQSDIYTLHIKDNTDPLGVLALYRVSNTTIELKNIAVLELFRSQGLGGFLLDEIKRIAAEGNYKQIIVGTPATGTKEIQFYERNGYIKYRVKRNFYINNYPEPIIENGIRLKDMVMLRCDVISRK